MSNDHNNHSFEAENYDKLAKEYKWFGPEILFGLVYEYINPEDKLLDIGIGTGLCSKEFKKAGLEITGINGSSEMLEVCRRKQIAENLIKIDIKNTPWFPEDSNFNIIISGGVFHFFGDLSSIFNEIGRILVPGGIVAFTIKSALDSKFVLDQRFYYELYEEGIPVYSHNRLFIDKILTDNKLIVQKELKFYVNTDKDREAVFEAIVAKKILTE
ncbi:class I SAM-dependent DNA methyltransferase [Bacteroidota bacterium]